MEDSKTKSKVMIYLLLVAAWFVMYLPGLGVVELKGEEGRRTMPGIEMLQNGNWSMCYLSGRPYYSKPPMINWLSAGSIVLWGQQSEFAVRFPSALFVLLFVTMLVAVPNRAIDFDRRVIAAILYMTTISIMEKGRQIEIEAVYVSMSAMACYWWLRGWLSQYSSWSMWLGTSAFLTMGMLTKGPVILMVFYAMVLFVLAAEKKWLAVISPAHIISIAVWAGIFLYWSSLASGSGGGDAEAMTGNWAKEILVRFSPSMIDWKERWETLYRTILNPMPWLLAAPLLWKKNYLETVELDKQKAFRAIRSSIVVVVVFLTLMPNSFARYSMPAIPLFCLLLAWLLPAVPSEEKKEATNRQLLCIAAIVIAIVSLVLLFSMEMTGWGVFTLACSIIAAICLVKYKPQITGMRNTLLSLLVVLSIGMANYGVYGGQAEMKETDSKYHGQKICELVPEDEVLFAYDQGNQIFLFYVREPLKYIVEPEQITADVHYLLIREEHFNQPEVQVKLARMNTELLYDFVYRKTRGRFLLLKIVGESDSK